MTQEGYEQLKHESFFGLRKPTDVPPKAARALALAGGDPDQDELVQAWRGEIARLRGGSALTTAAIVSDGADNTVEGNGASKS